MVIFMSLNLPLTKASTLQVQELTSLIRGRTSFNLREELNFWLLSKSRPCPCPWLGGFKLLIIVEINWGVNREILRCHLGRNGDGACKGTMNQWRNRGFVGSGRGLAQHTTNIKHCHNGPKASQNGVFLEVPKYPHFGCFWPLLPTRLNFFGSKWLEKVSPI